MFEKVEGGGLEWWLGEMGCLGEDGGYFWIGMYWKNGVVDCVGIILNVYWLWIIVIKYGYVICLLKFNVL